MDVRAPKTWCFWTVVLEKTLESTLDCKEIQPVHPKGDQSWGFIGRIDVEVETPIFWPPDAKSWLTGKDPNAGKDWGQEEKGMTEDEMVGWHHWLNGHGFGWTLGVGDGQGGLACCSSWGHKESDTTEQLNWTELNWITANINSAYSTSQRKLKMKERRLKVIVILICSYFTIGGKVPIQKGPVYRVRLPGFESSLSLLLISWPKFQIPIGKNGYNNSQACWKD